MRYNYASDVSVKMLVFEAKLEGTKQQYERLDEAIRTARFVRNSCIRYWMDNKGIGKYELSAYCAVLGKEFPWAGKLNSQARQATARTSVVGDFSILRQL
jgi:Transposase and inactivated derivatives